MDSHGIYPKQLSTPSFAHGRWFSKVQGATGSPLEAADGGRMDSIVGVFSNGCSSRQKNVHMIVYVCVCTVCVLYMYIHVSGILDHRSSTFDVYYIIHIYIGCCTKAKNLGLERLGLAHRWLWAVLQKRHTRVLRI